jgi:hypothetical protein
VEAGVAFHELRRWRVRERDIFRLGSGTIVSLQLSRSVEISNERVSIPQRSSLYQIGARGAPESSGINPTQASSPRAPSTEDRALDGSDPPAVKTISLHIHYINLGNPAGRAG